MWEQIAAYKQLFLAGKNCWSKIHAVSSFVLFLGHRHEMPSLGKTGLASFTFERLLVILWMWGKCLSCFVQVSPTIGMQTMKWVMRWCGPWKSLPHHALHVQLSISRRLRSSRKLATCPATAGKEVGGGGRWNSLFSFALLHVVNQSIHMKCITLPTPLIFAVN